jgi:hypothetical protein
MMAAYGTAAALTVLFGVLRTRAATRESPARSAASLGAVP